MAGVKFPSSFDVTGRFPLDDKFWVPTITNLSDGEIYAGLHRWTLDTGKEYVLQKNGTWLEQTNGQSGNAGTIAIGTVTDGAVASVTNVGTPSAATLNIVLPKGAVGATPVIAIGTVLPGASPAVTNTGTLLNPIFDFILPTGLQGIQGIQGNRFVIDFQSTFANRSIYDTSVAGTTYLVNDPGNEFDGKLYIKGTGTGVWAGPLVFKGDRGLSVYAAYADTHDGINRSFITDSNKKYISYLNRSIQPAITEFTSWIAIAGGGTTSGTAPADTTKLTKSGDTITGSILNTATGVFQIPSGTTLERPTVDLANGMRRYNTVTSRDEFYAAGAWQNHARLSGDTFSGAISASNLSGTNTGDQTTITGNAATVTTNANLTGDVTSVGNASTIAAGVVTNAKLSQVATKTYKGRSSALTGAVEDLSVLTLKTDLALNLVDNTTDLGKPISSLAQAAFNTYIDVIEYNAALADVTHTYLETSTLTEIKKSTSIGTIQFSRGTSGVFTTIAHGVVSSIVFNINELITWRVLSYNTPHTSGTIQLKIIIS